MHEGHHDLLEGVEDLDAIFKDDSRSENNGFSEQGDKQGQVGSNVHGHPHKHGVKDTKDAKDAKAKETRAFWKR